MQAIHSRTTTERVIRAVLLVVMVNGLSVAFLWDGYVGYARDNVDVLVKSLGLSSQPAPSIDPEITEERGRELAGAIGKRAPLADVTSQFGEPALEHEGNLYFIGPGGHLRVVVDRGHVTAVDWNRGAHGESDLVWQRWIGFILAGLGGFCLIHLFRVIRTRVSLTDEGLKIDRRAPILLEAITGVSFTGDARGEVVSISYDDNGQSREVRLGGYIVKELPAIVGAVCLCKGFSNPFDSAEETTGENVDGSNGGTD